MKRLLSPAMPSFEAVTNQRIKHKKGKTNLSIHVPTYIIKQTIYIKFKKNPRVLKTMHFSSSVEGGTIVQQSLDRC